MTTSKYQNICLKANYFMGENYYNITNKLVITRII